MADCSPCHTTRQEDTSERQTRVHRESRFLSLNFGPTIIAEISVRLLDFPLSRGLSGRRRRARRRILQPTCDVVCSRTPVRSHGESHSISRHVGSYGSSAL